MYKKIIKNTYFRVGFTFALIIATIYAGANAFNDKNNENDQEKVNIKSVGTLTIKNNNTKNDISAIGTVKADTKIDVVSLTRGTIRNVNFSIGDQLFANQLLVSLSDSTTLSNLINAQTNYSNLQNSLNTTKRITAETIKQAELSIGSAQKNVEASKISLKSAKDNLNNFAALNERNNENTKANAVISFDSYLNTVFNILNKTNDILPIKNEVQLPGLSLTLGAIDISSVSKAELKYLTVNNQYEIIKNITPLVSTIVTDLNTVVITIQESKKLVDDTIYVLDNTPGSSSFTDAQVSAQLDAFLALRTSTITTLGIAKKELQILQNSELVDTQQITTLENAVRAAENNLANAEINYSNSLVAFDSAKEGSVQQIIGAESALNNAQNQLNLANIQAGDLNIKTPISGQVTKKYIEIGAEVNPGTKIAEVSKTDLLVVETEITEEESGYISTGQNVIINKDYSGTVSNIYPTVDPITKKIKIEIAFDNKDNKLIPGSFVDLSLSQKIENIDEKSKIFIPLRAISITQTEKFVFVLLGDGENIVAKKRIIMTGESDGQNIEITDGLKLDEIIAINGNKNINNGEVVLIK